MIFGRSAKSGNGFGEPREVLPVVPAKAGTHTPRPCILARGLTASAQSDNGGYGSPRARRVRGDDDNAKILRLQNRRAGCRPAFQIGMGLCRILQRIGVVDRHVQFAVDHSGKQGVGSLQ
jgi:hypothetical protein